MSLGHFSAIGRAGSPIETSASRRESINSSPATTSRNVDNTDNPDSPLGSQTTSSHNIANVVRISSEDVLLARDFIRNYGVIISGEDDDDDVGEEDGHVSQIVDDMGADDDGCCATLFSGSTFKKFADIFKPSTPSASDSFSSIGDLSVDSTAVDNRIASATSLVKESSQLHNRLELSPLDVLFRGHKLHAVVCFPTTLDHNALLASLEKTFIRYPVLCGRFSSSGTSLHLSNAGVPVEVCHVEGDIRASNTTFCNVLRDSEPASITQLRDVHGKHMPAETKPGGSHPSDPVMVVKITLFDTSGTVIAIDLQRSMCDAEAMLSFMVNWSKIYRGIDIDRSIGPQIHNRRFCKSSFADKHTFGEDTVITVLSKREKHTPENMNISKFTKTSDNTVIIVPVTNVELEKWCKKATSDFKDGQFIGQSLTIDDVLTARVWKTLCTICCDQFGNTVKSEKSTKTVCLRSLDIRDRLNPPLCPGFFGNATCPVPTAMSVDDLLSKSVSEVALLLRSTADEWTSKKITSFLRWLKENQKYGSKTYLKNDANGLVFSVNNIVTKKSGQNWDDIEFDCKPMSYDYGSQSSSTVCDVTSRPDHDGVNIWYSGSPEAVGMFDKLIHDFY